VSHCFARSAARSSAASESLFLAVTGTSLAEPRTRHPECGGRPEFTPQSESFEQEWQKRGRGRATQNDGSRASQFMTERPRSHGIPAIADGSASWIWPVAEEAGIPVMMFAPGQTDAIDGLAEQFRPKVRQA
jgi:hypothetical protein